MKKIVHLIIKNLLLLTVIGIISLDSKGQAGTPELVFENAVLKSGQANRQGAIYRFSNVTEGVDAEIRLRRFSSSRIVMRNIDNDVLGWSKAFQPEFGMTGLVLPFQHWFIDFELTFFEAGTNRRQKLSKIDLTALDVDGDGRSVSEYVIYERPKSIVYSTVSYLSGAVAGILGQSFECYTCTTSSQLEQCDECDGDGITNSGSGNNNECPDCSGSGKVHTSCGHAFEGVTGTTIQGPIENFLNIDTLATQVMATYQYENIQSIKFRYGAKSGVLSSNGAGVRLNSTWFRQFSLAPASTLPVKLSDFSATYDKKNVNLSWTGHEENFSHYILQRSIDGKEFTDVALVFSNGNTISANHYSYKDANVSSATGMIFYRLAMVDKTAETAKLSEVKAIRLNMEQDELKLSTYPNPVVDQLRLTLPASWQGKPVMIELFTANGIRVQNIQVGSASQTETLQIGKYSKGVYLVKVVCENEVAQQRVIKN